MKVLVIGAGGFVGHYLLAELSRSEDSVYATKLPFENLTSDSAEIFDLDITDAEKQKLYEAFKPYIS